MAVCLDCRTALLDGEACDGGPNHRVRALADDQQREDYLTTVWGPPSVRQRFKRYGKAGVAGGSAGGFIEGCATVGSECASFAEPTPLGAVFIAFLIAGGAVVALYWLVSFIVRRIRLARNRPRPNGAARKLRLPGASQRLRGRVVAGGVETISPLGGRDCVGFYLELRCTRRASGLAAMLRDGATSGLTLELDSGEQVRVPPGRLRVVSDRRWRSSMPEELEGHLRVLEGRPTALSELVLFPHDQARETTVELGDRFAIVSPVERQVDAHGAVAGYRDAAPSFLVPRGVPVLRKLDS